jgi:hypothetical protein
MEEVVLLQEAQVADNMVAEVMTQRVQVRLAVAVARAEAVVAVHKVRLEVRELLLLPYLMRPHLQRVPRA